MISTGAVFLMHYLEDDGLFFCGGDDMKRFGEKWCIIKVLDETDLSANSTTRMSVRIGSCLLLM